MKNKIPTRTFISSAGARGSMAFFALSPLAAQAVEIHADSVRVAYPAAFQAVSSQSSLDSIQSEVRRQLKARYGKHYGCAALSLTAIAATLGTPLTEQQLRSMSDSFSGGIGHEFAHGTCGALSGAIMALGMYASGDKDTHLRMAAEVYETFQKQEGTVSCGDIYGSFKFEHCNGCNLCAVQKVVEVLFRNGDIQTSTISPWEKRLENEETVSTK